MSYDHQVLLEALHHPASYNHQVAEVKRIETHGAWILLAGQFAYKVKKPVNFGFLDYSTLARRQHFCQEEVRLNRRFAPQLYLGVISIGGTPEAPVLGGTPAFEYAVKMKRFPRHSELDLRLQRQQVSADQIEQFADYIAALHRGAAAAGSSSSFGTPAAIEDPLQENFRQLRPHLQGQAAAQLRALSDWTGKTFSALTPLLQQRRHQGFIRECHGDLHLANMLWLEEKPLLFDCIEFNENLRWIDVLSDIAFLLMDLDDHRAEALGWTFLNRYLQQTGDYRGLPLLNFYKLYRALVRAKVAYLRLAQAELSDAEQMAERRQAQGYLDLASRYSHRPATALIISHGFSGSGKSTFIKQLAPQLGAISLHSDIERKRRYGLSATAASGSPIDAGIYSAQASRETYQQLLLAAETVLNAGFSPIVDATFLKQQQRQQMQHLAKRLQRPLVILDFDLSAEELFQRVAQRSQQAGQISEATCEVLKKQLQAAQPLNAEEERLALKIHPASSAQEVVTRLAKSLQKAHS